MPTITAPAIANVLKFGAKGDGVAPDAWAIQEAIDFVAGNPNGGTVIVPSFSFFRFPKFLFAKHTYIIEKALDLKSNVRLCGSPQFSYLFPKPVLKLIDKFSATGDDSLLSTDLLAGSVIKIVGQRNAKVENIEIDGNKETNLDFAKLNKTALEGWQNGITIISAGRVLSGNCVIDNCTVKNCYSNGIAVLGSRNITIRRCITKDNSFLVQDENKNVLCASCGIYPCNFGIILSNNTRNCVVENCQSFRNPHGGIECYGDSADHQIRDCQTDSIVINSAFDPEPDCPFINCRGQEIPAPENPLVEERKNIPAPSMRITIDNCEIDTTDVDNTPAKLDYLHSRPGVDSGIIVYSASDITIKNCDINVAFNSGIAIDKTPNIRSKNITLSDNIIKAKPQIPKTNIFRCISRKQELIPAGSVPTQDGIALTNYRDIAISGNEIYGVFKRGGIVLIDCGPQEDDDTESGEGKIKIENNIIKGYTRTPLGDEQAVIIDRDNITAFVKANDRDIKLENAGIFLINTSYAGVSGNVIEFYYTAICESETSNNNTIEPTNTIGNNNAQPTCLNP